MTLFPALLMALFITAFALDNSFLATANFPNSMYITLGANHSEFLGNNDDLQLVLYESLGMKLLPAPVNNNADTRFSLTGISK